MDKLHPTKAELEFLSLAFNKFYDIYEEILYKSSFWNETAFYRFSKIKEAYSLYGELQMYEPIKWKLQEMKISRPPMESEIAKELFKCIRNIFSHFPFFSCWNEVWITEELINWNKPNQSIDKFIKKYLNHKEVEYRFWESETKKMTYVSIKFPVDFSNKIFLKDIISEREGVKFSLILMKQVMDSCVVK
ncbi:hypothetical protein HB943_15340 [Listeria weihenstephanensis]|uniref:Uncharacterized protein n=1 Tax=Listeria weihenstephanensis TaxID=1006155 RepID=A0A841Z9Y2_9LIST|nr:hypothetical protein [Listeria weihenstephanensis]MBC1501974.1 hypothetical protein [Listeria weihenstephanensis]